MNGPVNSDKHKADDKAEEFRNQFGQFMQHSFFRNMGSVQFRHLYLNDQQRNGNRKNAVAEGFRGLGRGEAIMPPKEQILAQALGTMQAPLNNFAGTLQGVLSEFVRTLQAVADKQQAA